jgi:hypothetical protein
VFTRDLPLVGGARPVRLGFSGPAAGMEGITSLQ